MPENSTPRNFQSGSSGNLDTCITIRTALLKDGKAYVQAGGGWVNDSEPEAEFQETVNKSKAMLQAVSFPWSERNSTLHRLYSPAKLPA